MKKLPFILSIVAVATLLTGCLIPHTSERSPEIKGRVVDSQNGSPVVNAKVQWMEQRWPSAKTDTNGTFKLESSKNWHLLYLGHASVPNHGRHSHYLFVTHPNYSVFDKDTYSGGELGTISLERTGDAQNAKSVEDAKERLRAEEASRLQVMRAADQAARDATQKAAEDARKRNQ